MDVDVDVGVDCGGDEIEMKRIDTLTYYSDQYLYNELNCIRCSDETL
jgi:hypothetical protein